MEGFDARLWDSFALGVIIGKFRESQAWTTELGRLHRQLTETDPRQRCSIRAAQEHAYFHQQVPQPAPPQGRQDLRALLFDD